MSEGQDRCYICLGTGDERPPLARPLDSSKLVQMCQCSLRAHARCLTDWASDLEYRARDDPQLDNNGGAMASPADGFRLGVPVAVIKDGAFKKHHIMKTRVKCPQCGVYLFIDIKPSRLLSLHNLIKGVSREITKTGLMAVVGSSIACSLAISVVGIFVSGGLQLFLSIAPESVLTKLLDFKSGRINVALSNEEVGSRQLFLLGSFPIFLYGLRSENAYLDLFSSVYPTFFFPNLVKGFSNSGPKIFLLFSEPLKRIYSLFYTMTFNRLYYSWTKLVKPIYLADRLSLEELETFERESQDKITLKENSKSQNIFQRLYSCLFGTSDEERAAIRKRLWTETKAIFSRDYSTVFHKRSRFMSILTTILWPILGAKLGKLLLKVVKINTFCNKYSSTPDEATYIANLMGSVLLVLVKDLFNLYIAWLNVKQLLEVSVVRASFGPEDPSNEWAQGSVMFPFRG